MVGKNQWLIWSLCFLTALSPLHATDDAKGVLIVKQDPPSASSRVLEYRAINQRLVPATDYITAVLLSGEQEIVKNAAIIQRIEYPSPTDFASILDDRSASLLANQIDRFKQATLQFSQAHKFWIRRLPDCNRNSIFTHKGQGKSMAHGFLPPTTKT